MSVAQQPQLDLFAQASPAGQGQANAGRFLTTAMKGRERAILLVIGLIVAVSVSYSAGYEQGRRAMHGLRQGGTTASVTVSPAVRQRAAAASLPAQPAIKKAASFEARGPAAVVPVAPQPAATVYTIQLASYKSRPSAEREFEALKKKGLSPLLLTKGEYIVLCVGNFSRKEAAQTLRAELQKRYQGCYVRRI